MSTSQERLLDGLLEISVLLERDQSRFVLARGTTPSRVHLLWVLGSTGPSTQSALARALEVSPRNVTGLVDGLVADGLVTRDVHATDRRAVQVTPTPRGARFIEELEQGRVAFADLLFDGASPEDLRASERVLEAAVERLRGIDRAARDQRG